MDEARKACGARTEPQPNEVSGPRAAHTDQEASQQSSSRAASGERAVLPGRATSVWGDTRSLVSDQVRGEEVLDHFGNIGAWVVA
jgi:hypothetical protein